MRRTCHALATICLLVALSWQALPARAVSHVFLVQNSGWMEPFFTDPASPYKALIAEVAAASVEPKDLLLLAAFNQSLPGAPSPKALLSATAGDAKAVRGAVAGALAQLTLARKPHSQNFADTDLNQAVSAAITQGLAQRPGLIWLFTNNKNSPNNDQATAARNREFYQLIHQGGAITAALAFPLKMPLQGQQYHANGLMVYVFATQAEGARQLHTLLARGRLQRVLTEPPARLKPLDQDTVRLMPKRVMDSSGIQFSLLSDGTLQADVAADARAPQVTVEWLLQNQMYPYTIASAKIAAQSQLAGQTRNVSLSLHDIHQLSPQQAQAVQSVLQLPLAQLPDDWSWAALRAAGSAVAVNGQIALQLSEQKLSLAAPFVQRMAELFPGDPLPDIFTPPASIHQSQAVLPLQVRVQYGLAPLLALLAGAAALAAAALLASRQLGRLRKAQYTLDGRAHTVQGRRGERCAIRDVHGDTVAQLQFGWFSHQLLDVRDGVAIRLG